MSPRHTATAAIGGSAVVVPLRIVFTCGVSTAPAQSLIRHCDPFLFPLPHCIGSSSCRRSPPRLARLDPTTTDRRLLASAGTSHFCRGLCAALLTLLPRGKGKPDCHLTALKLLVVELAHRTRGRGDIFKGHQGEAGRLTARARLQLHCRLANRRHRRLCIRRDSLPDLFSGGNQDCIQGSTTHQAPPPSSQTSNCPRKRCMTAAPLGAPPSSPWAYCPLASHKAPAGRPSVSQPCLPCLPCLPCPHPCQLSPRTAPLQTFWFFEPT